MSEKHRTNDASLRRLVAADWWEWMPGMSGTIDGNERLSFMVMEVEPDRIRIGKDTWWGIGIPQLVPIPSDPATAGCLLAMYLRESDQDLALMKLSATRPGPEAYASFGDFLVAELLAGDVQ